MANSAAMKLSNTLPLHKLSHMVPSVSTFHYNTPTV